MTLQALRVGPQWPAFRASAMLAVCVAAFLALSQTVRGVTPESPEVKQSIERGLGYLQKAGESEARLGGK